MSKRLSVDKTYKLFINGKFVRSESGRYYQLQSHSNQSPINVSLASRKDMRDAVVAARKAFDEWRRRSSLNRGQIMYRIAEMLEARKEELFLRIKELDDLKDDLCHQEIDWAIDQCINFAGWSDKYVPIGGTVNPVAGPFFNFSYPEPVGVVGVVCPETSPLAALVMLTALAIVPGNTCVLISSRTYASIALTFAEVLLTSDVPAGVVNILAGDKQELLQHTYTHKDINSVVHPERHKDLTQEQLMDLLDPHTHNLKRLPEFAARDQKEWLQDPFGPLELMKLTEIKTVWHPSRMP